MKLFKSRRKSGKRKSVTIENVLNISNSKRFSTKTYGKIVFNRQDVLDVDNHWYLVSYVLGNRAEKYRFGELANIMELESILVDILQLICR